MLPAPPCPLGAGPHLGPPRGGQDQAAGQGKWRLKGPSQDICIWKHRPLERLARKQSLLTDWAAFLEHLLGFVSLSRGITGAERRGKGGLSLSRHLLLGPQPTPGRRARTRPPHLSR